MRAVVLNCSLKPPDEASNTQALCDVVIEALASHGVHTTVHRLSGKTLPVGVATTVGDDDDWPDIHDDILDAAIVVFATPTWAGRPSSLAQLAIERMDAMLSESDDSGRPVAFNHVAGVVVTGNEDGAHHVISEISGALADFGFTIPGQAWTYWNRGPGPGPSYSDTDDGHEWSATTGRTMAGNLVAVARALAANPIPAPA
jgi:multimeric flavodoxin WrbA